MAKSMKAVLPIIFIVFLLGLSVQAAPPQPSVKNIGTMKPDLVVDLSLITEKYTDQNAGGITCYSVTPKYTVANKGRGIAANFRIKLEWIPAPGHAWEVHGYRPNQRLNPGQSLTRGPDPSERTKWCEGYGSNSIGFRVTADDERSVTEIYENNNTATKLFPSVRRPMKKKAIAR